MMTSQFCQWHRQYLSGLCPLCTRDKLMWRCEMHKRMMAGTNKCPDCESSRVTGPITPDPKPEVVHATDSRGAGMKFDGGKPRWSLLMQGCAKALTGVAEVLTFGAKKYSAHSWKKVENNTERYRDALYRHLNAIERGELVDPESGLPHWDHVACNALFLSELNHERT